MRAPAVSFANKLWAVALAALLTIVLVPVSALAEGEGETADASTEKPQEVSAEQVDEGSGSNPAASPAEGGTLASVLVGNPPAFINSDVALDGEPVVGSFTVDGMTFAVTEGSNVELVGVSPDRQQVASSQEGDGSPVAPMLASGPDGLAGDSSALALPESATYNDVDYAVTSIGAYALYLSGVTAVELPATVTDVDDRAFRSSDVASVTVADGNAIYSSFDGALYDADQSSLLLIPEGKQGTVLLPKTAESAAPSVFSHCPLVTQVSVEEGSAAFASENGLLYDASLTTLLRVPAGATDITIRDGCTTIAAGAMEACASLATIMAPASVTSISPDVFTSVPTVSLPAVAAVADDPGASTGATEGSSEQSGSAPASSDAATQITAMVALSSTDDDLPEVEPSAITVSLPEGSDDAAWQALGFATGKGPAVSELQSAQASQAVAAPTGVAFFFPKGYGIGRTGWHGQGSAYDHWWRCINDASDYNWKLVVGSGTPNYMLNNGIYDHWLITASNNAPTNFYYAAVGSPTSSTTLSPGVVWQKGIDIYFYPTASSTITWDANGGQCSTPSTTVGYAKTCAAPLPTRAGYRFTGWYSSPTGGDYICGNATSGGSIPGVPRSETLYAQWVSDYTIHFDGNVVDDDAHPATVPGDVAAIRDEEVELPAPTRFGYIFKGWATHPYGSTANGNQVFAPGEKVANLTDTPGDTVTLYALWALKYDADVPICAPADMTFALDATGTGEVKAVPAGYAGDFSPSDMEEMGSTHSAAIESRMAVPVEVESVSAAAAEGDGFAKVLSSTDGSAPEDQLSFTVASGDAKASVKAGQSQALSGLLVPEASDEAPVAKLSLDYGLSLADTAVVLANDEAAAVPVAKVSYTLDVIDGMASKWGFFMLDGGTPVTPTRIKAAADDLAEADYAGNVAASGYYEAFKDALDAASSFYLRVDDQPDGWFSVHEMNVLGICQDTLTTPRADASGATIATKAGLTFGFKDLYAHGTDGSNGTFDCRMLPLASTRNWEGTRVRATLNGGFYDSLDSVLTSEDTGIVAVRKCSQRYYTMGGGLIWTDDHVFIPNTYEVFGRVRAGCNDHETAATSFQYAAFALHGVSKLDYKGEECLWWLRSSFYSQANSTGFLLVGTYTTQPDTTSDNSRTFGILPCFAL